MEPDSISEKSNINYNQHVTNIQLFAVTNTGLKTLPVARECDSFDLLYKDLPLGVYTALRTYQHNKFLHLGDHLARTQRSMKVLGWQYQLDELRLRKALHVVCTDFPAENCRVRFDILAKPAAQLGTTSREIIAVEPLVPIPDRFYEQGVAVDITPALSRQRPLAKTAVFAQIRGAYQVGYKQEAYEQLLVDANDHILEGTLSNFWAIIDGVVYTASDGVLEGVTRKIILSILPDLGISLCPKSITISNLPLLSEAALSSSSRALMPIVSIAGQPVGNGRPGPMVKHILAAYRKYVTKNIAEAI